MLAADAEPMWIDTPGADLKIGLIGKVPGKAAVADAFRDFRRDGYVIFPGAIPHDVVDAYLAEYDAAIEGDPGLSMSLGHDIMSVKGQDLKRPMTKILDTHVRLKAALPLVFAPAITGFLHPLFNAAALAFQGLHFEVGSTQGIHQDTAYVVLDQPRKLAAAWIALEDIEEGTGELIYYPGSHRLFGEYLYPGGRKHFDAGEDGSAPHDAHLRWLRDTAREKGIETKSFLARKGDVLIWHADLAHGGSQIRKPGRTRRSLVVHYCPATSRPYYFNFGPEGRRRKFRAGDNMVSSMYYDVDEGRFPPAEA